MFDPRTTKAVAIVLTAFIVLSVAAWAVPNLYNSLFTPIEWYSVPSMFFRSPTNPASVIPVMASDGYRLPVDAGAITVSPSATLAGSATIGSIGAIINPLPAGTNTIGSVTVTNLATGAYWSTGSPVGTWTLLATSSTVNVASFITFPSIPCLVTIQPQSMIHKCCLGVASADVQLRGTIPAYAMYTERVGTTSWNLQLIADATQGRATCAIEVRPLY